MYKYIFIALMAFGLIGCTEFPASPYSGDLNAIRDVSPLTGDEFQIGSVKMGDVEIFGGRLNANLGDVRGVDSFFTEVRLGYPGNGNHSIHMIVDGPDGAAMVLLALNRPLSDSFFTPGNSESFTSLSTDDSGLRVVSLGCSGPYVGEWEFDGAADLLTLTVGEGPRGTIMVSFDLHYEGGDHGSEQNGAFGHFLMTK